MPADEGDLRRSACGRANEPKLKLKKITKGSKRDGLAVALFSSPKDFPKLWWTTFFCRRRQGSSRQGFVARWFGFGLVAAPADIPFSSARVGIHGSVGTLVIAWQSAG